MCSLVIHNTRYKQPSVEATRKGRNILRCEVYESHRRALRRILEVGILRLSVALAEVCVALKFGGASRRPHTHGNTTPIQNA